MPIDPKSEMSEEQQHDLNTMEEAGLAFDPTTQHLDLNKEEKLRTTALMMAIQAYRELIIKEASYLREVSDLARRGEGPALQPATIDAMIEAACKFELFIMGQIKLQTAAAETRGGAKTEAQEQTAAPAAGNAP
jgi:hypothetical protein